MSSYSLKCKCGAFEATFTGPPYLTFNCHCHSCVAVCGAIEAKGFDGTSIKSDESGGVAVATYKSNNVTIKKVDASKIGFMKVGEGGKFARSYCSVCKTVLFNAWLPNWCGANRNALAKTEGGDAYKSDGVMNIMCKYAFDKEAVPAPKSGTVPFGMMFKFLRLVAGLGCDKSNSNEKAMIPDDMSKVEVCPITWE
jgi:hypothetical protein